MHAPVIVVSLQGNGQTFRGFLIQARVMENPTFSVGSFASPSTGADYSLHDCASTEVDLYYMFYIHTGYILDHNRSLQTVA